MKKMLRIAAALAALLAMTNFIGCKNDDDDDGDVDVTDVKITSTVTEVTAGETITLTAEVLPADATNKTVTWTSSDNTVATVKDGVVTGVKAGETTITASAGGKNATVKVTVKAAATSGGETGGETGGSTGGTTGGETGGSTGGETGTTTEFENTYWVLEEKVSEFSGMKVTLQNFKYVYINDSTSGLVYMPDTDTAVEELITAGGGKRTVAYGEVTGNAFTYTVEGKNIILTLTATSEGKTETLTGTIVDENTLRFTNNADVDPFEFTLKKAAAAPTEATVIVEITAAPSTGVNAAWDFNVASLTAVGLDVTNKVKPNADKEIAVTSGSGATLTLLAQTGKSLKIQSAETGGLNVGSGTTETEVLSITVEGACTLKFNGKGSTGASSFGTTSLNSFSVNGTNVYKRASADDSSYQDFTYSITEAGTYKIAVSGMIFAALTCE